MPALQSYYLKETLDTLGYLIQVYIYKHLHTHAHVCKHEVCTMSHVNIHTYNHSHTHTHTVYIHYTLCNSICISCTASPTRPRTSHALAHMSISYQTPPLTYARKYERMLHTTSLTHIPCGSHTHVHTHTHKHRHAHVYILYGCYHIHKNRGCAAPQRSDPFVCVSHTNHAQTTHNQHT